MRLMDYTGSELIARICLSEDTVAKNQLSGKNTLFINGNTLSLVCKDCVQKFDLTGECRFSDNDTVFINSIGHISLLFSYAEYSQTIVVTNKCNSNCIMCAYTSSFRRDTTDTDADFILKQVAYLPDHTEHLVITGGEPTLKKLTFFELMKAIRYRFPRINCLLLSNGRSFSIDNICQKALDSFPKKTLVAIPLHASYPELHDRITQASGSFKQTITGIKKLLSHGVAVEIRIITFAYNHDDIINIARLIENELHSVSIVNFMAIEMCGNSAINSRDIWIDYNSAFSACEAAIDLLVSSGIDVGIYNFPLCSVPHKHFGLYRKSISTYKVRYGEICSECKRKSLCGGVFSSSLKYAVPEMKPFKENE